MLPFLAVSLLALLAAPQDSQDPEQRRDGRSHYLGREVAHTMHWTGAPWLLRATREDEENGVLLRRWLAVQPGQSVCDLGCGNGYHALPLADAVGAKGKVYAVDLQPQMLELLRQRARSRDLGNLELIEAAVDDPKLPAATCDLVLLVDVYHELSHPVRVMQHVRAALKPGGRVVLVEFRSEDPAVPIKPEHTMTKAQVLREMAEHGFALATEFDGLPWQHAMAFVAAPATGARFQALQVLRGFLAAASGAEPRSVAPFLTPQRRTSDLPELEPGLRSSLRAGPQGSLLAALRTEPGHPPAHGHSEVVLVRDAAGRWCIDAVRQPEAFVRAHGDRRPFFAMHTGTGPGPLAAQAVLVAELGFDGIEWQLDHLDELRHASEAVGTDVFAAYGVLELSEEGATAARLAPLLTAMDALAGGPGQLWLALRHDRRSVRDAAGDAAAGSALTKLLEHATATNTTIALYPHHGCWLETTADALRLCTRLAHPRLGLCFNLCHFLRTGEERDPTAELARCKQQLFAVTLNGADLDGTDWSTLIRPLGDGDFDLRRFLASLDAVGFTGPVGLQAFGITQPAREHLHRSMAAWRAAH